jgi:hypothetical protein
VVYHGRTLASSTFPPIKVTIIPAAMAAASSRQLLLLALCAAAAFSADAFYSSSSGVVSLTEDNFNSKIKSGGVWMVEVGVVKTDLVGEGSPLARCLALYKLLICAIKSAQKPLKRYTGQQMLRQEVFVTLLPVLLAAACTLLMCMC